MRDCVVLKRHSPTRLPPARHPVLPPVILNEVKDLLLTCNKLFSERFFPSTLWLTITNSLQGAREPVGRVGYWP